MPTPTLGTHLALALWPESADGGRSTSPGVTQDVAHEARRATQVEAIPETGEGDPIQIHSQYDHGSGNVRIALGPGDMIITAVSNGGTINIRSACEAMHLPLTQHAWTVVRHPIQANLQVARHNIDAFAQLEIESVTGTVWHQQRRRRPVTQYTDSATTKETTEQNTSTADGSYCQRRPSGGVNPQTPCTTSASTLIGSLRHMNHVQWESALNAPAVDNNPLVANIAREAAGETLSSFGAGASTDMIQALATWLASHVRNRRATRAPNHWCWSITTVGWLIARAMRHNGNEHGLSVRSLAPHFGMNAAGMRQRPIATWEQEDSRRTQRACTPSTRARCHQARRFSASMKASFRTPIQGSHEPLARFLIGWFRPYGPNLSKRIREMGGNSDDPHTDDAGMQINNDNASERTAMSIDRVPEEVQANTPATIGVTGEEHENRSTHPFRSQCGDEEAQDGRDCRSTENPLEDRHADTQANNTVDLHEHRMGGNDHAQSAAASTKMGNPFESEGISPTVPFTHPDVSSTIGDGGEDALGSIPWPEHAEEGNGRLDAAEGMNHTADENRTGHIHAPNTNHTSQLTHAERGGQSGHDSPDTYVASSESGRKPDVANNAGTNRPGHRGEHTEADANDPNGDTTGAADANPRAHTAAAETGVGLGGGSDLNRSNGHPSGGSGTSGMATTNTDNQNGATDA